MKLIVILAGLFAVVAVAHAYSTNLLEALLQALPAELEQEEPSMERYRHGPYEEIMDDAELEQDGLSIQGELEIMDDAELEQDEEADEQATGHTTEAILAQAMCQQASQSVKERVYAVGRACKSRTSCTQICTNAQLKKQDPELRRGTMGCAMAFHVYKNRPATNLQGKPQTAKLGLKSRRALCNWRGCGPNFCCCVNKQ